jgi:hypothetical protein
MIPGEMLILVASDIGEVCPLFRTFPPCALFSFLPTNLEFSSQTIVELELFDVETALGESVSD